MNRKIVRLRNTVLQALGIGSLACFLCTAAYSETSPATVGEQTTLDEVIVTAQKRSERLVDVPISVTVVDTTQLENAGIEGLQDLDKVAVGTKINRVGVYFQPSIRGITTQVVGVGQENNVAVYVDGFYQPSQVGINADFDNIKSVQVLKGPQGTLFGRNATGGAILIDTLAPSFTPTGKASLSYGRFNEVIAQGYFSNGLTDHLAFDVSAYWKTSDGYIKDIAGFNTDPVQNKSVRSKLLFTPNDELRITGTLEYAKVQDAAALAATYFDRQLALLLDPTTPIATAPNRTSVNYGPISRTETTTGALKTEYDFGAAKLTSYTRYSHELGFINFDLDGSKLRIFEQQLATRLNTASQEFNLGSSGRHFDWVTGLFASSSTAQYFNNVVLVDAAENLYGPASDSRLWTKAAAAFADATYHFDNAISVTGGLRYSWEKRTFFFAQPEAAVLVDHAAKSWNAVTPRVVVRYEVAPSSNIYASFSKGFKSGTFNTTSPISTPVNPENVKAYEIGFKTVQGAVQFDTAAYYYDYKDLQVSTLTIINGNQEAANLSNAAVAKIYGLEAQLSVAATQELSLSMSAAYSHARYTSYTNASIFPPAGAFANSFIPAVQDWSGLRIIGAPDWTANMGFQYIHPTAIGAAGIAGNIYYSSEYAPGYDDQLSGTYRYQQGAYALGNVNVSLAPDTHWKFMLWSRNVTNKLVKIANGGNPFGDNVVYAEPRTYGVKAEYSFK
ncbi:MAG TPA: TonB-dependent receptor [Steroidobacteraceae bacterium]|jgi:iron complex outermembrane receptor protein